MPRVRNLVITGETGAEVQALWVRTPIVLLAASYTMFIGILNILEARGLEFSGVAFSIEKHVNGYTGGLAKFALTFLGCLMVFLAYQLWLKKRAALVCLSGILLIQSVSLAVRHHEMLAGGIALSLSLALLYFRKDFPAMPDPSALRRLKVATPILAGFFYAYGLIGLWLLHGRLGLDMGLRELLGRPFLIVAGDSYGMTFESWEVIFHYTLTLFFFIGLVWTAAMLFRPHRFQLEHDEEQFRKARELVELYGSDSTAYFNLRRDKNLFFLDGNIFLSYRCIGGTVVVSGDPVGPAELVPELMSRFHNHCLERGWRLTALAAADRYLDEHGQAGLKHFCYGEEAVIQLEGFTLEGRKNKTLRHAVAKWDKSGAVMEFMYNASIPAHLKRELAQISADWRGDNPETGFSMGLGRLMSSEDPDCLLAIAYDGNGSPVGFAYLVPVYPKVGYSLDITRTSLEASNGINEFIFTKTAAFLKEQGHRFMSLHFAAFSQHYRKDREEDGSTVVRGICRVLDSFLPVMSLYDFDRKFMPGWTRRNLLFESYMDLPRLALAAVTAESFHKLMRRVKRAA